MIIKHFLIYITQYSMFFVLSYFPSSTLRIFVFLSCQMSSFLSQKKDTFNPSPLSSAPAALSKAPVIPVLLSVPLPIPVMESDSDSDF